MKFVLFSLVTFLASAQIGFGAEAPVNSNSAPAATLSQSVGAPSAAKVHGFAEFRPSYTTKAGEVHSENAAELGYDFSKSTFLFYRQEFNTNLYNPANVSGTNVSPTDGYIKMVAQNLYSFSGTPLSLSYEGRYFLPTLERKREAGMLTTLRNYVWLKYAASNSLNFYLAEAPMIHVYKDRGYKNAANPIFENRVELVAEYIFTDKVKLVFPFKLSTTRYSNYQAGAKNNDAWGNYLYVHPELTYRLNANWKVGTAFYSGALTNATLSGLTIGDGLSSGIFQTFVAASL